MLVHRESRPRQGGRLFMDGWPRWTRIILWWGVATLAVAIPQSGLVGQSLGGATASDRFQLYTACASVYSKVDIAGAWPDFTEASVERAVNSRLRSARIHTAPWAGAPFVHVDVQVGPGGVFRLDVSLVKRLEDPLSGWAFPTPTWRTYTGGGGADGQDIHGILARYLDRFLDE